MTKDQFGFQIQRLEQAFGEKNFANERLDLIAQAVMWMELGQFSRIVDHFIATHRTAPLPKDFIEASRIEKRARFLNDVSGAARAMDTPWPNGLQSFLKRDYPGCKTINEAVQVQILRNQVARAKDGIKS